VYVPRSLLPWPALAKPPQPQATSHSSHSSHRLPESRVRAIGSERFAAADGSPTSWPALNFSVERHPVCHLSPAQLTTSASSGLPPRIARACSLSLSCLPTTKSCLSPPTLRSSLRAKSQRNQALRHNARCHHPAVPGRLPIELQGFNCPARRLLRRDMYRVRCCHPPHGRRRPRPQPLPPLWLTHIHTDAHPPSLPSHGTMPPNVSIPLSTDMLCRHC
jgi:hypothetical protein